MSTIGVLIRLLIVLVSFILPLAFIVHDAYRGNYIDWLFGAFVGSMVSFCMFMIVFVVS